PALVEGEGAEGGHAGDRRHRQRAAQRAAAGVGPEGHGHAGGVRGHQVVEGVEHLHGHRRAERSPRRGVRRLLAEGQAAGPGGGGGGGEGAGGGGQGVAGAAPVEGEVAEGGDAADGGRGGGAAQGAPARVAAQGDGDAGAARGDDVVEGVRDGHLDGGAEGHA